MKIRNVSAALVAALFTVGCGDIDQQVGDESGAVAVSVHALSSPEGFAGLGEISSVSVKLTNVADPAITETFGLSGPGATWTGTSGSLVVGTYGAEATVTFSDTSTWQSGVEQVIVTKNNTSTVTFILNQETSSDFGLPQFLTIKTDKASVKTGDDLSISVTASGSSDLVLWARNWSGNPAGTSWVGAGVPGQEKYSAPGATNTTTLFSPPGPSGQLILTAGSVPNTRGFILILTDSRGNNAEMGVMVPVVPQEGNVSASIEFNLAPVVDGHVRVLNDGDGTTAYIWFKAIADASGPMSWSWAEGNGCVGGIGGVSASWRSGGVNGPVVPSNGTGWDGAEKFLVYTSVPQLNHVQTCDLLLTVEDSLGAKTTVTYKVQLGLTPVGQ